MFVFFVEKYKIKLLDHLQLTNKLESLKLFFLLYTTKAKKNTKMGIRKKTDSKDPHVIFANDIIF